MALSPTASHIWDRCEEYVEYGLKHLVFPSPQPDKSADDCFDYGPEMLRVRFLFPGIAKKGFDGLLMCRQYRWMHWGAMQGDAMEKSVQTAMAVEHTEAEFEAARAEVLKALRAFSPVQQEIILEEYLGEFSSY